MGTNFHTAWVNSPTPGYKTWGAASVNPTWAELDLALTYLKNVMVGCEGVLSWTPGTGVLAWNAQLTIVFNRTDGQACHNHVTAGNVTLTAGQFAYCDLSETDNATVTVVAGTISTGSASNFITFNRLVLAYRSASSGELHPLALSQAWVDTALPAHNQNANTVTIPNGVGTPTYDDMQDFLNLTRSAGRLTGGVVTKGTGATVSITELEGMIFTGSTLGTSPLIYFKMPQQTNILGTGAIPNLQDVAVNWIYIDYAGGTPVYKATTIRSDINDYTMFAVARVWVSGASIEVQASGHSLYNKDRRAHNRLILKYGGMDRVSGAMLSAHATPLRMSCSIGNWYVANTPFISPTSTADSFSVLYKTGASPTWVQSSSLTLLSEVFDGVGGNKIYETYQDGDSLASLGGNHYGVYWVFLCPTGHLIVVLGTASYSNIGAAQAATVPGLLPARSVNWSKLIGRIICKKTAAALYSVESSFSTNFTLSAATDHSSLANLSADDHSQYLLAAGTRAVTGDIDFNGSYQCHDLQAPAASGEAIRATTKITEALLESATDLKHDPATAGTGIAVAGQAISLLERNANLTLYPEYPGAVMTPSGSNNDPGTLGMISDTEVVSDVRHNYYEWKSSIATPLQSYDIALQIPIPFNFTGFQVGTNVALSIDIKTEETAATNNDIDITINRDGQSDHSHLTSQRSGTAATWTTVGYDETDAVLAAVVAGETLNVLIRLYSMASKYTRIGKINLKVKLQ